MERYQTEYDAEWDLHLLRAPPSDAALPLRRYQTATGSASVFERLFALGGIGMSSVGELLECTNGTWMACSCGRHVTWRCEYGAMVLGDECDMLNRPAPAYFC